MRSPAGDAVFKRNPLSDHFALGIHLLPDRTDL